VKSPERKVSWFSPYEESQRGTAGPLLKNMLHVSRPHLIYIRYFEVCAVFNLILQMQKIKLRRWEI
jgi:hypothetical protein